MRTARVLTLALGASLVLGAVAAHAETPDKEMRMLGRCALASSVYKSLMPPAKPPVPLEVTAADKDLYARLQAVEPLLSARADKLAATVDPAVRDGIGKELTQQFQAQMAPKDGPRKTPREALDLYAPILEACIVRAAMQPAE